MSRNSEPPKVDLTLASAAERPVLENLIQFYVHDFSEFWWDREGGDFDDDGRFGAPFPLDAYWDQPDHVPLLVRAEGRLIGFVLVNAEGHSGQPTDHNVAEFFIARKYRRGGYGTATAQAVFDRYPGRWEAAVVRRNVGALSFWRKAIGGHPNVADVREDDVTSEHWDGAIIRFRIGA
jgi:predicted acetyltransferase